MELQSARTERMERRMPSDGCPPSEAACQCSVLSFPYCAAISVFSTVLITARLFVFFVSMSERQGGRTD